MVIFIIKRKVKFIYSAFILLVVFSNGVLADSLLRFLEYPWKRLDYSVVNSSDGIVVLSSGRHMPPGNSKIIEWGDPDRFLAGIDLYKANKSNRLIFTGGINPFYHGLPPEGDIYIKEALSMGIPKQDLFSTYSVTNTLQEAKAVKKILNNEISSSQKKVILVTSAFHMKRAKKVFEQQGIVVFPYPVDFRSSKSLFSSLRNPLKWVPNSSSLSRNSFAIREVIGRIIYRTWK